VHNGVVELKTGGFRTGQREDFITKQAGVSYDPNARCPEWLTFLDTIMGGDAFLKSYIQRVIGYALTGLVGEEVMFVFYGIGNNGKSTFRETCHALLGDYAIAADASLLIEQKTRGGQTRTISST
jgi:putative DNA primase/helicase